MFPRWPQALRDGTRVCCHPSPSPLETPSAIHSLRHSEWNNNTDTNGTDMHWVNWKSRTSGSRSLAVTTRITIFWLVTPFSLPPSSGNDLFLEVFFPEDGSCTFFRKFVDLYQPAWQYIPKDGNCDGEEYTSRG